MAADPYRTLGAFLTAFEAQRLATALRAGYTAGQLLNEIHLSRRTEVRRLLAEADIGPHRIESSLPVLEAIAGARSLRSTITPVWTMPGSEATIGRLTSEARRLIDDARMSVVCSSFNFAPQSRMWTALLAASNRPGVSVTVYLDARVSSTSAVAAHLPKATVYRTMALPGSRRTLVSH
ncbi:MAG TPA: phospholipase, partial [Pseudonocardiaceae bacterium]|nr:phospholipase [Pseudonocardiaceae bacterium]